MPKTLADACVEGQAVREWQNSDVKNAFDHVEHRAACKAMRQTNPEPVLDCFDRSDLEWKLHERTLGCGTDEQSTDES